MKLSKRTAIIFQLVIALLYGCKSNDSFQEKFNELRNVDYSQFDNLSIVHRNGIYYVTYHNKEYKIKRSFLSKKISSVETTFGKSKNSLLSEEDTSFIEHALTSFDKIRVQALSVDKNGNIDVSLPWSDKCTYYFIRLSKGSTLKDLSRSYYQNYKGSWYMNKQCSER